jgi:hypothetical protein
MSSRFDESKYQAELSELYEMSYLEQLEKNGEIRVVERDSGCFHLLCWVSMNEIIKNLNCKFLKQQKAAGCKVHSGRFLQLIRESPELQQKLKAFVASEASDAELLNFIHL